MNLVYFFIYLLLFFFFFFFAVYAEIQDGRLKWRENDFCENSPVDSADTLWVKHFVKIQKLPRNHFISLHFRDKRIFVFDTKIQDGRQKWRENVFFFVFFYTLMPVDSADTLWVKHFVKIALSLSVSEINTFCILRRNSRWPPKVAGK